MISILSLMHLHTNKKNLVFQILMSIILMEPLKVQLTRLNIKAFYTVEATIHICFSEEESIATMEQYVPSFQWPGFTEKIAQ